jgi:hypothetical protein
MLFQTALTLALAAGAIEIPHTVDGTLGAGATPASVTSMITAASWRYSNPDKEHSTWESITLTFDASGNVDVMTYHAWGPRTVKKPWHVVRAGNAPSIEIDGVVYAVAPCSFASRTMCLAGLRP